VTDRHTDRHKVTAYTALAQHHKVISQKMKVRCKQESTNICSIHIIYLFLLQIFFLLSLAAVVFDEQDF